MLQRAILRLLLLLVTLTQGFAPFLHAHAAVARTFTSSPLHLHLETPVATNHDSSGKIHIGEAEDRIVTLAPEYKRDGPLILADTLPFLSCAPHPIGLIVVTPRPSSGTGADRSRCTQSADARAPPFA